MKKVILSLVTLLAATTLATAQMRPTIKVEAGANFSNQTTKIDDKSTDGKMMIGYRAGVGAEFGFADGFYVNPGVYFLSRGAKSEAVEMLGAKTDATLWLHNVEIPVHVGYRAAIAPDMSVSIQAGPWFSYGFLGKRVYKATGDGLAADAAKKIVDELNKGDNNPYKDTTVAGVTVKAPLKPFDLGVGMQAAFEYRQFGVNLGFEYGLLNTSNIETPKTKVNNMNFYVGLGYRF
ncbi:MAG: porin family protein [Porphyromonas sp.]|uniref:porin family protein n=1 Tax=Porphyromonas sp. TaxID=1924944 RepID=UPI002A763ABF|nr:porin family protein [Porphyromonas sp.]MDY3111615.1 porin family protein [Porphyromonas sp.]